MRREILALLGLAVVAHAQIPGIGWCPDKRSMTNFDIDKYLGTWYEAERYFTVLEAGSRCARTNYTKATDGRILVTNEITNRLTGIKRVLDGEIRNVPKGGVDSKITVKYSTLPFPMETEYIILDTDYDTFAVVWSCSSLGPLVNTQSAWVMTRDQLAPGTVIQKAHAVLDKHKISRNFFVTAEQGECNLGEAAATPEAGEATRSADAKPEAAPEAKPEAKPDPKPEAEPPKPAAPMEPAAANSVQEAAPEKENKPAPAISAPTPVPSA